MPSYGDSALYHVGTIQATNGTTETFAFTDLSPDYRHLSFVITGAFDYDTNAPRLGGFWMGDGSLDTTASYNRGLCWGYNTTSARFGDNRQTYATMGYLPNTQSSGTSAWKTGHIGVIRGTIWNYSDSAKATTVTWTCQNPYENPTQVEGGSTATYPYWAWGWSNYRVANVVDHFTFRAVADSIDFVQGSKISLYGFTQ
jgi:hypothetical protein